MKRIFIWLIPFFLYLCSMQRNPSNIKQVILIRKDLNMSAGKVAVQVAHASMEVFFSRIWELEDQGDIRISLEEVRWNNEGKTKILKEVKNESQLLAAYEKAKEAGFPCALITDAGLTELEGENNTTVAIGPADFEEIQKITKRFRLYNYKPNISQ